MLLDLLWTGGTQRLDLADGTVTVGGSPNDGICLEGLPHGLLTLTLLGEHVSVIAQRAVRIGDVLFPARRARLLVQGEDLKLPNDVVLRRVAPSGEGSGRHTVGTAFVADGLLAGDAPRPSRAATLTCVAGPDAGRVFPLPFDQLVIGRSPEVDLQVTDRLVSRRHARVTRQPSGFVVAPAPDAMNGLRVNGQLVRKERPLATGDVLELGQTVLRFEEAAVPGADLPPPAGASVPVHLAASRPIPGQPSPLAATRREKRITQEFPVAPPGSVVPPALAPALGAPRRHTPTQDLPATRGPSLTVEPIPAPLVADQPPRVLTFTAGTAREVLVLSALMTGGGVLALAGAALAVALLRLP